MPRDAVDVEDLVRQPRIIEIGVRQRRSVPGVERRAGQLDQLTESLHLEEMSMVINEPAATHLVVSRAKYCAAFFRISRTCFSSAFSLRNRFSSARSSSDNAPGAFRFCAP